MADTAASSSSDSQGAALGGLFGSANPVGGAAQAVSTIATTISSIDDANKRRHFEEQLGVLSNQQQQELALKLMNANSETEKLQILSDSMVQYAIANENSASNKDTVLYIIAAVMAMTLIVAAIVLKKKQS